MPEEGLLTIERLAYGGAGVGHLSGKVCFVPGTVPGDQVRVRVVVDKRSYAEAILLELLVQGDGQVTAPCPIFGVCGGCQWQQLEDSKQLRAKEEIFSYALGRTARVEAGQIRPIAKSALAFGYRSRIQVKICHVNQQLLFGFYRQGTHRVVDFPAAGCIIADARLNQALAQLRRVFNKFPEPHLIPQLDLATGDDGGVLAILHYLGENVAAIASFLLGQRAALPDLAGMFLQLGRKAAIQHVFGDEFIYYHVPGNLHAQDELPLRVARAGFSQVNLAQNRQLVAEVLRLLRPTADDRILDLYCGNGNFSIPIARSGAKVLGMDDYEGSILDARANALNAGVAADFVAVDAGAAVAGLLSRNERFTGIVLDPPRAGAGNIVGNLHQLGAQRVVYVSCDPMTLARDLSTLKKGGFAVVSSMPLDMFPQTYHIESITLLNKD